MLMRRSQRDHSIATSVLRHFDSNVRSSNSHNCCILLDPDWFVHPGAQMDGMKVSDSLSDVACSLSYIYLAVE